MGFDLLEKIVLGLIKEVGPDLLEKVGSGMLEEVGLAHSRRLTRACLRRWIWAW